MNRTYPCFNAQVELHRTGAGGYLFVKSPEPEDVDSLNVVRQSHQAAGYEADGYLIDFLTNLDGVTDSRQLQEQMTDRYGSVFGHLLSLRAWEWLESRPTLVSIKHMPASSARPPRLTGDSRSFVPVHSVLEIIETCNFACEHCYYSSSPSKTGRMTRSDAKRVMDKLHEIGVRALEITGGECTIHPDFKEIASYASNTFDLVAIITNGYRLGTSPELAKFVSALPNVVVQISIDGMGESHDRFRKHRGSFKAAAKAVRRLRTSNVPVRIASSITVETLSQVADLVALGNVLDVQDHAFTPVAPLGRGCNITEAGASSTELTVALQRQLEIAQAEVLQVEASAVQSPSADELKSDRRPVQSSVAKRSPRNCGAGWRTYAIDFDGWVRACNYSRDSKRFGNILDESAADLFGRDASYLFNNAPSPGGLDCQGCQYYYNCRGCFAKAFSVSESLYPDCPWRRRWFPGMSLGVSDRSEDKGYCSQPSDLPVFNDRTDGPHVCAGCSGELSAGSNTDALAQAPRMLPLYVV